MRVLAHGQVASAADGNQSILFFPSIERLPNAELLVNWRAGSAKDSPDGDIYLSRSADNGKTWAPAQRPFAKILEKYPGELRFAPMTALGGQRMIAVVQWVGHPDPKLPFFNPKTEGLLPTRPYFMESSDAGHTWAGPIGQLENGEGGIQWVITSCVLRMPDGSWGCPVEPYKQYEDTKPWRHAAVLKLSRDGGKSWNETIEAANDPTDRLFFYDGRYIFLDAKRGLSAFWTYDRTAEKDANIHLSHTSDGGRTWTYPADTGLAGQIAQPLPLGDGKIVMVYVDRFGSRSIRARLSTNNGQSFDAGEVVIYQQPAGKKEPGVGSDSIEYWADMMLWTFGQPHALIAPDGTLWVVYYAGDRQHTNIHWAQIEV